MEGDVIEEIGMLREALERLGMKEFSELIFDNVASWGTDTETLIRHCWKISQGRTPTLRPTGQHPGHFDYVLYGMLQLYGKKDSANTFTTLEGPNSEAEVTPFSIIVDYILCKILRAIKDMAISGQASQFQRAIRKISALLSQMFNGAYGLELYENLGLQDLKRTILLLRTLLSFFLDHKIDRMYPQGKLPIHTVFIWARCVLHVVNVIKGCMPKILEEFDHDLIIGFKEAVRLAPGKRMWLFIHTMRVVQTAINRVVMTSCGVSSGVNTMIILAVLISEFKYNNRLVKDVAVELRHWDITVEVPTFTSSVFQHSAYPMMELAQSAATYLLERGLKPMSSFTGVENGFMYNVAICQTYLYMNNGYFNFKHKGNFIKRLLGDKRDGGYNTNALLDFLGRLDRCKFTTPNTDVETSSIAVLRAIRLLQEGLFHMIEDAHTRGTRNMTPRRGGSVDWRSIACDIAEANGEEKAQWLSITARTLLVCHLHYFKRKILVKGIHNYDVDYYSSLFKMTVVTLHRCRGYVADEIADILTSILLISLKVVNKTKERDRVMRVVPQTVFCAIVNRAALKNDNYNGDAVATKTWKIDLFRRFSGRQSDRNNAPNPTITLSTVSPRDAILRVTPYAYTNARDLVKQYVHWYKKPYDFLKIMYQNLKDGGLTLTSLFTTASDELNAIYKGYEQFNEMRKEDANDSVDELNTACNSTTQAGSPKCSNKSRKLHYGFSKCLQVSSGDEKSVTIICIASEVAILCLQKHKKIDNKAIALSFIFLNTMVLLLVGVQKLLAEVDESVDVVEKRFMIIELLLETYLHVQAVGIKPWMRSAVRASLSSLMAVCDAVVELLVYRLIKTEVPVSFPMEETTEDRNNFPEPVKWRLLMACLRCITASPTKDIMHVINTLCLFLTHNVDVYRKAVARAHCQGNATEHLNKDWVSNASQMLGSADSDDLTDSLRNSLENANTAEKLIIHAMTRYLSSVAINLKRLKSQKDIDDGLDGNYMDGIMRNILRFMNKTMFIDPSYNVTILVPFIANLSKLMDANKVGEAISLVKHCTETHNMNRRRNSVAYAIPFTSDPRRAIIMIQCRISRIDHSEPKGTNKDIQSGQRSCKHNKKEVVVTKKSCKLSSTTFDMVPYIKEFTLSSAKIPNVCFYCRRRLKSKLRDGYFYVTCSHCLHPSPLLCEGEMDTNNVTNKIYISTKSRFTTRRMADGAMFSMAANTPNEECSNRKLNWDMIISSIANTAKQAIHPRWNPGILAACSKDISDSLAFYLKSVPQANEQVLDVASRLRWIGDAFAIWIIDKQQVYKMLRVLPMDNHYMQFFQGRFDDNLTLMTDSSTDMEHLGCHYFYDALLLSLGSSTQNPTDELGCMDFWKANSVFLFNLSVTTLSQLMNNLLQKVIDSEEKRASKMDIDAKEKNGCKLYGSDMPDVDFHCEFTRSLCCLAQVTSVFSIPLTKLLVSGMALTVVRTATAAKLSDVNKFPRMQNLLDVILSSDVIERIENIHDNTMKAVVCCDSRLNFTLDNCDYKLFQIMQNISKGEMEDHNMEYLRKLDKYKFYAMVRLLWYVTNPHVILKIETVRGNQPLLAVQAAYVESPFKWFLEIMRNSKSNNHKNFEKSPTQISPTSVPIVEGDFAVPGVSVVKLCSGISMYTNMQVATQHKDPTNLLEGTSMGDSEMVNDVIPEMEVMMEYLQENFVRILEYFVAVWLRVGTQKLQFALKNKRVFYPEIYSYKGSQNIKKEHIVRAYNCIAILIYIYHGDMDVFCDRMIEVLTLCPIDTYKSWMLLNCWAAMAAKISSTILGWYAPGIAYHLAKIGSCHVKDTDLHSSEIEKELILAKESYSKGVIEEIKVSLKESGHGERFRPFIDCIVECVNNPSDLSLIHLKLSLLATMVYSDDQIKVPYVTREAAALTANQLFELNPFIFNLIHAREASAKLAMASLLTIAAYSDDFAKEPTSLSIACCSILGYIPCDLSTFRIPKEQLGIVVDLQCSSDDPSDLAALVLRGYLIPNMHMQVALYCIQEILKLLGLYKGGVRSHHELMEMGERWNQTFEPVIRRAIEPYRATSFLRNRAIEDIIETRLEVNTVLDIKSFVWWLLKMLPSSCPTLPLFRACDLAMVKIPSVLSFLLPYIVDSCVQFLDDTQCITIGKRMASLLCNILKRDSYTFGINWQPPYELSSKSGRSFESRDHYTSCQAIFNLLDNVRIMLDRYMKALDGAKGTSSNGDSKGDANQEDGKVDDKKSEEQEIEAENEVIPNDVSSVALQQKDSQNNNEATLDIIRTKIKRLQYISVAVPELLVAHAAISCGSYARGVMIIEKKLTCGPCPYNFSDPGHSLSHGILKDNVQDNGGLPPHAIISLLCRGYCGLADFDSVVCISNIVLNDDPLQSTADANEGSGGDVGTSDTATANEEKKAVAKTKASDAVTGTASKRQRDVCRAFAFECRGKYRQACEVYNKLLKDSQDSRLWASWYRIIQMAGPSFFIKLPKPPEVKKSFDSLIAEAITACWKLSLWDELDDLLVKKRKKDNELLELQTEELSSFDLALVDRTLLSGGSSEMQWTQCTVNGQNDSNVFWESLLMRDPIDVWFMEETADAMSNLHKSRHDSIERTVEEGFKHLIRPLGLAIRESTLVAVKYLEKIASLNAIRLSNRFNSGKYNLDERRFARELISIVHSSTCQRTRNIVNVLGTAKVALELGGKLEASSELLVSLNRTCRINNIDIHIPGKLSLDDEILSARADVVLENALTLHNKGNVDDAIAALNLLARHDFDGFYNLVKIYSESNLLIPKLAVSYMREILQVAPQSFKANLLHAEYLDRLLDHRLKNAQNIRLVLDDTSICSRRSVHKASVEATYKIVGVEGIPGVYSFVQLVAATVYAYLQTLSFVSANRAGSSISSRDQGHITGSSSDRETRQTSEATTGPRSYEPDEQVVTMSYEREGVGNNSTFTSSSTEDNQDIGGNMDIVDILTKVIAILCFYCTPNTTQFSSSVTFESEACQIFSHAIMERFFEYNDAVPQFYWYAVISQLMSRCHHNVLGSCIFQTLVARLVARYPKQALWSTLYFAHSVNARMRKIHANIERKARELSQTTTLVVEYYHSIFKEMSKVAMDTTVSITDKSAMRFQGLWKVLNSQGCREFVIIPTIHNLSFEHIINYDMKEAESRMCGLNDNMQVLRSKQKPKKIGFITTSGRIVHFLVKNEVKGDLRKDKRMMEVTQYLAMLLKKHYNGLPIQCYSVVSLTEVAGIIEWVPNMATMRALVMDELRRVLDGADKESKSYVTKYAASVTSKKFGESLKLFRTLCEKRPPVLHRAYYNIFKRDPAAWFCARKEYIHTCAVWSILGYIVGLGDRHAENILLNITTGQIMHVDFDCLFGKGIQLAIPELVPFRMTQNVVCNMGVCGTATDGPFYSEALKFLQMLHQNRQKITAILMSFVFDPLIEWNRGEGVTNADTDSQKVIQCIEDKLRGALNVVIPSVEINSRLFTRDQPDDTSDLHVFKTFETVAEIMEPRQQLQQLIHVATSHTHLSKMFVGWAPWM